jgi:glucose-1-phosphate thymidylyltransferase
MKGIILAGGKGSRLYPLTFAISKHLLPVYDKPMIYYPLSVLMLAGIKEILIISTPSDIVLYKKLLGDGSHIGIKIIYSIQNEPKGIAEAFLIGEKFIGKDEVALILGDNIFYGYGLIQLLEQKANIKKGAHIFSYFVNEPERYGIIETDKNGKIKNIKEKPNKPKSNYAITGLYFYDNKVINFAKTLKHSDRGELEITDLNKKYLEINELNVEHLGRGMVWLDTGTHESLLGASNLIQTVEQRQGLKIGCLEEIAYTKGYINKKQLLNLSKKFNNQYGKYLISISTKLL